MTASLDHLRRYLGGLTVYLRNFGATLSGPTLDRHETGEVGFELTAGLPGSDRPRAAVLRVGESWEPARVQAEVIVRQPGDLEQGGRELAELRTALERASRASASPASASSAPAPVPADAALRMRQLERELDA